jgi:hypothetical protein
MQFYFRTSESTGIGVGPIGLLFVGAFYLMVAMLWVAALVVYLLFKLVVFATQEVARARAARS